MVSLMSNLLLGTRMSAKHVSGPDACVKPQFTNPACLSQSLIV